MKKTCETQNSASAVTGEYCPSPILEFFSSLRRVGIKRTAEVVIARLADLLFDAFYGLETSERVALEALEVDSQNLSRGQRYQPTSTLAFRRLIRSVPAPRESVFVDFGCGKGRVTLLAAEYFERVRGIEFSPQLCSIAEHNVTLFRKRKRSLGAIEVLCIDANDYEFSHDESVLYFFHPFDQTVLTSIIQKLLESLRAHPRDCWIVYYLPVHNEVLESLVPPTTVRSTFLAGGYEGTVYKIPPMIEATA
jgi:SAM-dependent methyltransferase